ncbi:MAG: RimK family alpha-L-glutamate ligase [Deltaproteobacteria bacterium]|nr:RimK family alpha-L-glutamate ligase [Deltaproteobacteria bacterium]MBW2048634.1 RimK family alpha-L-glutamate ligase [Deltaproteobacteria bacterium]MBW2111590.1 RimK family alpha-L-glutamate ligase [Deltaproteobacteria bacterium]MBW2353744.1 RimK family alpha-L-glutamate ligase [Deltaproteobacteria bacterium]HDZ89592.1 RimK family alpha-L-glutamate ligase [Deltaproteobacteria bacterium]
MAAGKSRFVALGSRLRGVPEVLTLGVRPNFPDYTPKEQELIFRARLILFPTLNYAQFLTTLGKRIFPSLETYLYADEKIKQTTLFQMSGILHPRTRVYFHLHHGDILRDFTFPFVAKIPRCSARGRGVFKVGDRGELEEYLSRVRVAYIQEYLPHDRDLRVVLINYEPVISFWRISSPGEFRTNLSQGGRISFDSIPSQGVETARRVAWKCRFNDVGIDLINCGDQWYVIEANMKYGRKGLRMRGLDLKEIIRAKLLSGDLLRD